MNIILLHDGFHHFSDFDVIRRSSLQSSQSKLQLRTRENRCITPISHTGIHKYKNTDTNKNTQIQVQRYKYKKTQMHKYKSFKAGSRPCENRCVTLISHTRCQFSRSHRRHYNLQIIIFFATMSSSLSSHSHCRQNNLQIIIIFS